MLTCFQSPGGVAAGSAAPATSTRPSAGDSTASGAAAIARSGSRKKNRNSRASTANGAATAHEIHAAASAPRIAAPPMNGHPAESTRARIIDPNLYHEGAPVRAGTEGIERIPVASVQADAYLRRALMIVPMLPHDDLHAVLQRQLAFFQGDFFDLFGL